MPGSRGTTRLSRGSDNQAGIAVQRRVSGLAEIVGMRSRIRDAFLIATVGTALVLTGSALYGLGRRLPPPPEVRPAPVQPPAGIDPTHADPNNATTPG